MNIDIIIKKTIIYGSVTLILLSLYFILVAVIGNMLVSYTGIENQPITIASTLAIAAVFIPVKNRIQRVIDRRFYRKKYDYPQAIKTIASEIQVTENLKTLLKFIAEQSMQILPNQAVAIFQKGKDDQTFRIIKIETTYVLFI